jgi:hypothetical protein
MKWFSCLICLSLMLSTMASVIEEEGCDFCCEGFCTDYSGTQSGDGCEASLPPAGGYCLVSSDNQSVTCRSYFDDGTLFDSHTETCGGYVQCDWWDPLCFIS